MNTPTQPRLYEEFPLQQPIEKQSLEDSDYTGQEIRFHLAINAGNKASPRANCSSEPN